LPQLQEPKVHVVVEYSEIDEKAVIKIRYNGPTFDPLTSDNEISLAMLKSSVDSIQHEVIDEDGYSNLVVMEREVS
jgi:hypothetical protein